VIGRNPAAIARPPRVDTAEIVPLTVEQARAVLQVCPTVTNGVRYALALALGLRQGEALGLSWSDLELDPVLGPATLSVRRGLQRQIWQHGCPPDDDCRHHRAGGCRQRHDGGLVLVEPKSPASRRTVILPAPLVAALRSHRLAQRAGRLASGLSWSDGDLVFTTTTGRPIDPRADLTGWKDLLVLAGVPPVRLHDARHTAATLLLAQGTDQRTVMAILGWSHSNMAEHYQHVLAELRAVAAENLGLLLWPASAIETRTETRKRAGSRPPTAG
jgi:integrase